MNEKAAPWVGLFIVSGLFLLGFLTFLVDDEGNISIRKKKGASYKISFDNAGGLIKGAQVYRDGVKVGKVTKVRMDDGKMPSAVVELMTDKFIYENDSIKLQIASLIAGGQNIHLITNRADQGDKLPESAKLMGESPSDLATVIDSANSFMKGAGELVEMVKTDYDNDIHAMITNLREASDALTKEGTGTIAKLMYDDKLHAETLSWIEEDVRPATQSILNTAKEIEEGDGTLHNIIYDKAMYENISKLVKELNKPIASMDETLLEAKKFITSLNEGEGVAARLANDPAWGKRIDEVLDDVSDAGRVMKEVFTKINEGDGAVARLINDLELSKKVAKIMKYLENASDDIAQLTKDLRKGKGTLGRLLTKDELYEEAANLLGEVRSAVEDSREFVPVSSALGVVFGTAR